MQYIGYSLLLIYILFFILYYYFFYGFFFFFLLFFFSDYKVKSTWWQIYLSIYHQVGTRSVPIGTKWAPNLLTPWPNLLGCFSPLQSTWAQSIGQLWSTLEHLCQKYWADCFSWLSARDSGNCNTQQHNHSVQKLRQEWASGRERGERRGEPGKHRPTWFGSI